MNAVFFDLDDTLIDTLQPRLAALATAYRETVGGMVDPRELWRTNRGRPLEELARELLGDDYRRLTEAFDAHYYGRAHRAEPFPGVERCLAALRDTGVAVAVITSRIAWGATDDLARAGLLDYVAAVVGFDDTEEHAPNPEPLYEALDRVLLDTGDVISVGDAPADIRMARAAGITSAGALWGTLDAELLRDAMPDHLLAHPGELLALLAGAGAA